MQLYHSVSIRFYVPLEVGCWLMLLTVRCFLKSDIIYPDVQREFQKSLIYVVTTLRVLLKENYNKPETS